MIISVDDAKMFADVAGWTDSKIEMRLKAIEQTIRAYTNNNFQARGYRVRADIRGGIFYPDLPVVFATGDTIQVSDAAHACGLYTVAYVEPGASIHVNEDAVDEDGVLVTKVVYPADVKACAVNLLEWEVNNRAKVGIQSETLSRHSVTYYNMDGSNNTMGYPASLLGCLKPYRKARC